LDFPIQPFNDIVVVDFEPMFSGKTMSVSISRNWQQLFLPFPELQLCHPVDELS